MTGGGSLTDVPGILVGHAGDPLGLTGCTVILCEAGAVGGVDQRGGAPGTRETDLLQPMHLVKQVHAIVLAGGSAFGLAAADGVMRYLAEKGVGYGVGSVKVPIVPAAILFDLSIGDPAAWPSPEMGLAACRDATPAPAAEGNVGAGTGCSVGKMLGPHNATKSGVGTASVSLPSGLIVAALVANNAFGDVFDEDGRILAGVRQDGRFIGTLAALGTSAANDGLRDAGATVIGVVASNARLSKEEVNKVAQMAHDGIARAVRPAHTMLDGDTLFALATGEVPASATVVGAFAAEVVCHALRRSVLEATPAGGLPCARDLMAA